MEGAVIPVLEQPQSVDASRSAQKAVGQLLFSWSRESLSGGEGMGLFASSIAKDRAVWLEQALEQNTFLSDADDPTASSLSLHQFERSSVLMRRTKDPAHRARPNSTVAHALVDLPRTFDPCRALELYRWQGWITEGPEVPKEGPRREFVPVFLEELECSAAEDQDFTKDLKSHKDLLSVLLAQILRCSGARCTIVDVPEAEDRRVLLWGLLRILVPLIDVPWTFSTLEVEEHLALPRIVMFKHEPPPARQATGRRRIFPALAQPEDHATGAAQKLVQTLLDEGQEGLGKLLGKLRDYQAPIPQPQVRQWLEDGVDDDGGIRTRGIRSQFASPTEPAAEEFIPADDVPEAWQSSQSRAERHTDQPTAESGTHAGVSQSFGQWLQAACQQGMQDHQVDASAAALIVVLIASLLIVCMALVLIL